VPNPRRTGFNPLPVTSRRTGFNPLPSSRYPTTSKCTPTFQPPLRKHLPSLQKPSISHHFSPTAFLAYESNFLVHKNSGSQRPISIKTYILPRPQKAYSLTSTDPANSIAHPFNLDQVVICSESPKFYVNVRADRERSACKTKLDDEKMSISLGRAKTYNTESLTTGRNWKVMWPLSFRIVLVFALLIGQSMCCCSVRALAAYATSSDTAPVRSCCCHQLSVDADSDSQPAQQSDLPCHCKKSDFINPKYVESTSRNTNLEKLFLPTSDLEVHLFVRQDAQLRICEGVRGPHSFSLLYGLQIQRTKCVWIC
jgi:hypothetical protein